MHGLFPEPVHEPVHANPSVYRAFSDNAQVHRLHRHFFNSRGFVHTGALIALYLIFLLDIKKKPVHLCMQPVRPATTEFVVHKPIIS